MMLFVKLLLYVFIMIVSFLLNGLFLFLILRIEIKIDVLLNVGVFLLLLVLIVSVYLGIRWVKGLIENNKLVVLGLFGLF